MENEFKTKNNLPFEIAEYPFGNDGWILFRVGTCEGLWRSTHKSYEILAIKNNAQGNGHLNDMFQWFEHSCRRDNKSLKVLEVWNDDFKNHLINKRGFKEYGDNVEKKFYK